MFPKAVGKWFESLIESKTINKDNWLEYWNKYNKSINIGNCCYLWIKTYHDEPPLEIYISPNSTCGEYNRNTCQTWADCVNRCTIPKEMTSMNYWQYMIESKGKKRNPNQSTMYSFFSNTDENKIIFCRSDVELQEPAKARYNIPVLFSELKPFLHEEIITNDICSFTHLTKDDWNKVAGGNDRIDVVVFSEMKNIYKERTPLKQVLSYLVENIEINFSVECDKLNLNKTNP